jgi:hypothetical protein
MVSNVEAERDDMTVANGSEQPWAKDTLIVIATGCGQDEDGGRSKEAGVDHHVKKPVGGAGVSRLRAEMNS